MIVFNRKYNNDKKIKIKVDLIEKRIKFSQVISTAKKIIETLSKYEY